MGLAKDLKMETKRSLKLSPDFSMPTGEQGREWFARGWALAPPPTPEELNRPEWSRPEPEENPEPTTSTISLSPASNPSGKDDA